MTNTYGANFFENHSCDIETKFARFYKIKSSAGMVSIIKVFKGPYDAFFSEDKYRLLQKINSPLMVAVEHINVIDQPYVQYEFFDSMTLKEWLHSSHYISKETLLSVISDMASIIDLLHANNLVHLDVVGNFLINPDGQVKLNDYDYVEVLNGSGKHKIDLHSFFELVYRLIYFLGKKESTQSIRLEFNDAAPDYSTCNSFLNSLFLK
ncbi:MAG: protein kinase [Methyloprofundus sp.]|nr:protein kinase [Methyloprofundus sp.]